MRIDHDDRRFDIAGKHRCNRRAGYAHLRETALAENQEIIEHKVDENRHHAGQHREPRFAHLAQRAGIDLRYAEGQQPPEHHSQVIHAETERCGRIRLRRFLRQIHADELLGERDEHGQRAGQHG